LKELADEATATPITDDKAFKSVVPVIEIEGPKP